MNNKNTGMIATIAAVVLCGCPGLFICLFGAITATGNGTFNDANLSPSVGVGLLCASLLMILVPVAVGFFTLRKKPDATADEPPTASSG